MELVDDQVSEVSHVLGDINAVDAVAVHCIENVGLIGSQLNLRDLGHVSHVKGEVAGIGELAGPVKSLAWHHELLGVDDEALALLSWSLFCFVLFLEGFDEPDLVAIFMESVLIDGFPFDGFSARDVEGLSVGMSFDDVASVLEGSFVCPDNFEPTAVVLAWI